MSDTPRTDAALVDHMPETSEWSQCYLDLTIHARQLERELNALKQERADFGALVDKQDRELGDLISLLASEESARNYLIIRGADLKRQLNEAKELIREIRDNEVNAVDEATKFLRDYPINKDNK